MKFPALDLGTRELNPIPRELVAKNATTISVLLLVEGRRNAAPAVPTLGAGTESNPTPQDGQDPKG